MTQTPPYRLEQNRSRTVLALLPELNEAPWSDIEQIGTEIVGRLQTVSAPALLVDLTALHYMGSSQVALVVRLYKVVKERRGKMVVVVHDPMVHEVLKLAGLDKLWTITNKLEDALSELGGMGATSAVASRWCGGLGVVCLLCSLVGLVAVLWSADWLAVPSATWVQFGGAAAAFVLGMLATLWGTGASRTVGVGIVLGSLSLMLASVFLLGSFTARGPLPNQSTDSQPSAQGASSSQADDATAAVDQTASDSTSEP